MNAVVAMEFETPVNEAGACSNPFEEKLIAVLQSFGTVTHIDNWCWSVATPDGIRINVARGENWLHFSTNVERQLGTSESRNWQLLESNCSLPAGIRYAVDQRCSLRADLPMDGHWRNSVEHLTAQVSGIVDGFTQALSGSHVDSGESIAAVCPGDEIRLFCDTAGWTSTTRADDGIGVELDVHNGYYVAELVQSRNGAWCFQVQLGVCESGKPTQMQALGLCLLRASDAIYLARPFANAEGAVGYEVALAESTGETHIRHALSALSVACQHLGREISALLDHESLAEIYLGIALGPNNRE